MMSERAALVTGAARRFGAEMARALAGEGYLVLVHANTSRDEAAEVVADIERDGGRALLFVGDLTQDHVIHDLVSHVEDTCGQLDVIINSASHFAYDFPGRGDIAALRVSLEMHIIVPFMLIEHFSKYATEHRPLDVFNILDQKLLAMNPDYMSYTIGKAALKALTDIWQVCPGRFTRVFGIMPGNMYPSGPQSDEDFARSGKTNLLGRTAAPREVCEAILFFLRNKALPAQNLAIDAGEHLASRQRDPAFGLQE